MVMVVLGDGRNVGRGLGRSRKVGRQLSVGVDNGKSRYEDPLIGSGRVTCA